MLFASRHLAWERSQLSSFRCELPSGNQDPTTGRPLPSALLRRTRDSRYQFPGDCRISDYHSLQVTVTRPSQQG